MSTLLDNFYPETLKSWGIKTEADIREIIIADHDYGLCIIDPNQFIGWGEHDPDNEYPIILFNDKNHLGVLEENTSYYSDIYLVHK